MDPDLVLYISGLLSAKMNSEPVHVHIYVFTMCSEMLNSQATSLVPRPCPAYCCFCKWW